MTLYVYTNYASDIGEMSKQLNHVSYELLQCFMGIFRYTV